MSNLASRLQAFVTRHGGLLPLKPCLVGRGYRGGGRLAGKGPGMVRRRDGKYLVERWIASSTGVGWGAADADEGRSYLAGFRPVLRLKDALACLPEFLLGSRRAAAHDGEFRVLTKVLDPYDPIGFHFHQSDAYVRANPGRFPTERFGKDEAYYFLPGPKGAWPYTHVGILPDVSTEELIRAMQAGREALLDISPYILQRQDTGFFVPAGMVHSPGTMLTLEVQQPSDVGGGFGLSLPETVSRAEREAAARGIFDQIDLDLCRMPDLLQRYALQPETAGPEVAGIRQWWIMPPRITRKFSAKHVLCAGSCTWREQDCFALYAWAGQGRINGQEIQAQQEFFVPSATAATGLHMEPGPSGLEAFAIFAETV